MFNSLTSLIKSKSGASAAEYALIVAVMGGLVVAGALAFGTGLQTANESNATAMTKQATGTFAP